ncbi:hypothetical protein I4U23_030161 [Adineta vaga]|nr:hypothetical protein I4U23_030161 [Adineta vaga]
MEWKSALIRQRQRLKCSQINITVIAVYSPINPANTQMADDSEKFYVDLQDTVNRISIEDMLIIVGDFNARTSWMYPGTKVWHMLDYTLVNRKFRSSIEDIRMLRSAAGVLGTDHHLMRVKIKLHLRSRKKQKKTKYNISKFKDARASE